MARHYQVHRGRAFLKLDVGHSGSPCVMHNKEQSRYVSLNVFIIATIELITSV